MCCVKHELMEVDLMFEAVAARWTGGIGLGYHNEKRRFELNIKQKN